LRRTAVWTAYIARVLSNTKITVSDPAENNRLSKEASAAVMRALDYLEPQVNAYDEPYLIASYALTSFAAGQKSRGEQSLERLRKLERREGDSSYWSLETNTPSYGWGLAGRIETTALVLQALHEESDNGTATDPLLSRGLLFLLQNQDRLGIWYSTQATVNVLDTLRALTSPTSPGVAGGPAKPSRKASVLVDGRQVLSLDLPGPGELVSPLLVDLSKFISAGPHHLEISRDTDSAQASVQVLTDYYVPWTHTATPENSQHRDQASDTLRLRVQYDNRSVKTGEVVRCDVEAERIGFRGYGMMLAEIGLPPGAEVDRDSLETALQGSGWEINHYDVLPDRVVVYLWPHAGGTKLTFAFKPRLGEKALTPPSTLYDYYNPEAHALVEPVEFRVGQ
jgi:hypothetical protein